MNGLDVLYLMWLSLLTLFVAEHLWKHRQFDKRIEMARKDKWFHKK